MQGSSRITYTNTSQDTLSELAFHTYANANRSASTQTSMFKRSNEEIGKNIRIKTEDFLGGIEIENVTSSGQALDFSDKEQALTVQLNQPLRPGDQSRYIWIFL